MFEAIDPSLDRRVAIKLLHGDADPESVEAKRLLREARALAQLNHPNIVEVYGAGIDAERVWLAMELVEGQTLKQWVLANPPESAAQFNEALWLLKQAADGLSAAHAVSMTHRDFKPANVLIGNDGRVRVADFGLALRTAPDRLGPGLTKQPGDESVTRTGAVMGTPRYMSPEQHRGREATARSDQFSFAVTAWELLHGTPPFAAKTTAAIYDAIVERDFREERSEFVPVRVTRALKRALSDRPKRRFRSIGSLVSALDGRRQRRIAAVTAGVMGIGIAALASLEGTPNNQAEEAEICTEAAQRQFDAVWDSEAQTRIAAAIEGADVVYGESARTALGILIASYRADWMNAAGHFCEDAGVVPTCLTGDLKILDGLLEASHKLSPKDVERLTSRFRSLPDSARCVGTESGPSPARERGLELLTAAEIAKSTRDYAAAQDYLDALLAEEALPWDVRVDGLLALASTKDRLTEPPLAECEAAYELAVAHRSSLRAARAAFLAAYSTARDQQNDAAWQWVDRYEAELLRSSSRQTAAQLRCRIHESFGEYRDARVWCERALADVDAGLSPETTRRRVLATLTPVYLQLGDTGRAVRMARAQQQEARQRGGPLHPETGGMLLNLSSAYLESGDFEAGANAAREARHVFEQSYGPQSRWVVSALMNEAAALKKSGDLTSAQGPLERAVALLDGVAPAQQARVLTNLADLRHYQGRLEDALSLYARVEAIQTATLSSDSAEFAYLHSGKASVYTRLERWADAEAAATRALAIRDHSGELSAMLGDLNLRANALRRQGNYDQARRDIARALRTLADIDVPQDKHAIIWIGAASLAATDPEAEDPEHVVLEAEAALEGVPDAEVELAALALIRARIEHRQTGHPPTSERLNQLERALKTLEADPHDSTFSPTEAASWLKELRAPPAKAQARR